MISFSKLKDKIKSIGGGEKNAKKNLLLALSLVIICTAVFLNWRLSNNDSSIEGIVAANSNTETQSESGKVLGESVEVASNADIPEDDDYFAVSVIERERVRDEAIERLRDIVYGAEASSEEKNEAMAKMTAIADDMTSEVNIENLIIAKGFADCLAVVDGKTVDVVVKVNDTLTPEQVAQIKDIAVEQVGASVSDVRIIEKK